MTIFPVKDTFKLTGIRIYHTGYYYSLLLLLTFKKKLNGPTYESFPVWKLPPQVAGLPSRLFVNTDLYRSLPFPTSNSSECVFFKTHNHLLTVTVHHLCRRVAPPSSASDGVWGEFWQSRNYFGLFMWDSHTWNQKNQKLDENLLQSTEECF